MAKYCKFCGKPIPEGGTCDCAEAVAEAEQKIRAQIRSAMDTNTAAEEKPEEKPEEKQTGINTEAAQKAISDIASSPVVADLKQNLLGMFKAPVKTLREAAQKPDKTAQYIMAAVTAVVEILAVLIFGCLMDFGAGNSFKIGLAAAVFTLVCKAVYAIGVYALARKYNPDMTVFTSLGEFCMVSVYDAVCLFLIMLFMFTGLVEIMIALIFAWLAVSVMEAAAVTGVLTGDDLGAILRINMILQVVIMIVLVFVIRSLITMMISSLISNVAGMFMNW